MTILIDILYFEIGNRGVSLIDFRWMKSYFSFSLFSVTRRRWERPWELFLIRFGEFVECAHCEGFEIVLFNKQLFKKIKRGENYV